MTSMPLRSAPLTATVLTVDGLSAGYVNRPVLFDLSLTASPGEIVAVLGHNGAGKTTLLRTIFGLVPTATGRIEFDGVDIRGRSYWQNVRAGMSFTPAETSVFRDLSVRENLELGAFTVADAAAVVARRERVFELFPILQERTDQLAGTLSGGQQRMLSLGIALMAGPRLMLLDEPSLGLAPALVNTIFEHILQFAHEEHLAVVVVEQNVRAALKIADRAYFLRAGHFILEESGADALARGKWWDLF
jgi:branched-chain amino acid transport system ATP-binding protein